jgi:hypothetical protein
MEERLQPITDFRVKKMEERLQPTTTLTWIYDQIGCKGANVTS